MEEQTKFVDQFVVAFHEVDHAGVLFFGHLFTHAHVTYEHFMAHMGLELQQAWFRQKCLVPIVHAAADYLLPLHHGSSINVGLHICRLGGTSFTTAYEFSNQVGQIHAKLHLVHCCVNPQSNQAQPIPDKLLDKLKQFKLEN